MRMGWALATAVVATAACGSSAAAPTGSTSHPGHRPGARHAAATRCGPAAAKTIAADARARVYAVGGSVYGCTGATRRAFLIGHRFLLRPGKPRIDTLSLTGVMVAYSEIQRGVDTARAQVVVRRLDSGRVVRSAPAISGPLGPEFFESVVALVVKPDGAVAWLAHGGSILQKKGTTEVDRIDRRGAANLDRGAAGNLSSLKLSGSRLRWRHGNAVRTSTLL